MFGPKRILALIATIIFLLAAVGSWPTSLADDFEAVPLGLAVLALSFCLP